MITSAHNVCDAWTRKWPANQTFSFMYPCTVCDWKVTREDGDPSTQRASVELVENHYENAHGQRVRIKLVESLTIMRPVPVPAKMPAVVGSPPTRPKTEVEHTQSAVVEQMKNLKELRELGLITPTEFDRRRRSYSIGCEAGGDGVPIPGECVAEPEEVTRDELLELMEERRRRIT